MMSCRRFRGLVVQSSAGTAIGGQSTGGSSILEHHYPAIKIKLWLNYLSVIFCKAEKSIVG
jgi:hypothetical protein